MHIDNCTHVMLYFIKQEFWEENNAFENNKDNFTALFALRLFAISLFKIEAKSRAYYADTLKLFRLGNISRGAFKPPHIRRCAFGLRHCLIDSVFETGN